MGWKNYISVYCDDKLVLRNYNNINYKDHPKKNSPYVVCFNENTKFIDKTISVRVISCENRIYFLLTNQPLSYSLETEENKNHLLSKCQFFKFQAKPGLKIKFYEDLYIKDNYEKLINEELEHFEMDCDEQFITNIKKGHFEYVYKVPSLD